MKKITVALVMSLMLIMPVFAQESTTDTDDVPIGNDTKVTYPVTVDGVSQWFFLLAGICKDSGVPSHDVHINEMSSDGVFLSLAADKFVSFVEMAEKCFGTPQIMVQTRPKTGGLTVSGRFEYDLEWPNGDVSTVLDDQLERMNKSGVEVAQHTVVIIVAPVGDITIDELVPLMSVDRTDAID